MTHLHRETHSHLGWHPATGFGFARQTTIVPLAAAEIARVAQVLPVLFRKLGDHWQAVAVMGPVQGTNVYVARDGKWRTSFVPALLRVYPFRLAGGGELGLWENYEPELLAGEGVQPFFENGALSKQLQETVSFLKTVHMGITAAHRALSQLEGAGVLTAWAVPRINTPQPERMLTGLHAIDAKRFETLNDHQVLDLFRSGTLHWLHAHLDSLHHAAGFKALAKSIVAPEIEAPRQPDKLEQAADILAAIAEDLGDAEL